MSNLDRAKWEKHYEAEDILFIDEEEVLKLLWSVSSEAENDISFDKRSALSFEERILKIIRKWQ